MMDNNDHTSNPTQSTSGADTGPAVREMSPQVRAHARGTLLAETSRKTVSDAALEAAADGVRFGRDGVDDVPTPLKKRWMVVAAGLTVASAGTDQSEDVNADSAEGAEGANDLNLLQARADCMDSEITPGIDDSAVLYEHQTADYAIAAVTYGGTTQMCATTYGEGTWGATQPMTLPAGAPIAPFEVSPAPTDKGPYPVIGQAAPNVTSVDVVAADENRRETELEDGYYTLMLPATDAEGPEVSLRTREGSCG